MYFRFSFHLLTAYLLSRRMFMTDNDDYDVEDWDDFDGETDSDGNDDR